MSTYTHFIASLKNPARIKQAWSFFQKIPFGNVIFSKIMGGIIPYTGKMSAIILKIEQGYAEVKLKDRRKVRNHLNSIHAIALANLGEFCGGLALFSQSPPNAQAILVKLECTYIKKARGTLIASSRFNPVTFESGNDYILNAEIKDHTQEVVATVSTTWRIRLV